jgi:2-methylisocitrate lyase-like PEP mutase family enzyme
MLVPRLRYQRPLLVCGMSFQEKAKYFRSLHVPVLVLPNAWDPASARLIEHAGAKAIAIGSAGVAWAHGKRDGHLTREEAVEAVRRIVQVVSIPVTADIESGYDDVAATIRGIVEAGAVGCNLEDSPGPNGTGLVEKDLYADRIRAARETGGDIFINARTDVFLNEVGAPETRLKQAIERGNFYREAGADCIFVPGVTDEATIQQLVSEIDAPLNVLIRANSPKIQRLREIGVVRASAGPRIAEAAHAATLAAAREMLERGTYDSMKHGLYFGDVENIIAEKR